MKNLSYLYMSTAVIAWGLSFIWTKSLIAQDIPVMVFMFLRIAIAALVLTAVALATKQFVKIRKEDIKLFLLLGLCEPFIYFIGESYGIKATDSPTLSALVIATFPIFSMMVGRLFYSEKLKGLNILGIIITLPGVFLMAYTDGGFTAKHLWGIALLFVAVFSSLGYSVVVKKLAVHYEPMMITTMQFIIGTFLFLPTMFIVDGKSMPVVNLWTYEALMPIILLGVLCSAVAFLLYVKSLKNIGLTRTAIFTALIPVVTAIASAIFGYESFTLIQLSGILIVVCGVILTQK